MGERNGKTDRQTKILREMWTNSILIYCCWVRVNIALMWIFCCWLKHEICLFVEIHTLSLSRKVCVQFPNLVFQRKNINIWARVSCWTTQLMYWTDHWLQYFDKLSQTQVLNKRLAAFTATATAAAASVAVVTIVYNIVWVMCVCVCSKQKWKICIIIFQLKRTASDKVRDKLSEWNERKQEMENQIQLAWL